MIGPCASNQNDRSGGQFSDIRGFELGRRWGRVLGDVVRIEEFAGINVFGGEIDVFGQRQD